MSTIARPATLSRTDLRRAARDAAAAAHRWSDRLPCAPERRGALLLHRDEAVEIWALSWHPGHDTGFHDHGDSAAAIAMVSGELREERLTLGAPSVRTLVTGDLVDAHPEHVHRVVNTAAAAAVSVHAYSPPLREVAEYRISSEGLLERVARPGDHDLGDGEVETAA